MRILYIVPSLIQAGPVNVALDLVRVMTQHGHTCDVAYFDDRHNTPLNLFPCKTFQVDKIEWLVYDIVHTHGYRPNLLARRKMPRHMLSRLVSTMHNLVFEENRMLYGSIKGWIASQLELWAVGAHRHVITLTPHARNYYAQFLLPERLHVCCNTRILELLTADIQDVDSISDFRTSANIKYLLGSHCTVTYRKGLEQVINALPELPSFGFLIIGDGPQLDELKEMAEKRGVSNRVLWLGRRPDAFRYIPLMDLYVIPSRSEGFPLALLEVAASGTAAVSSDIDVFKNTFPNDNDLPKFQLDNIESLVNTIKQAIGQRNELGHNLKAKFEQEYSPEVFFKQHIEVYNTALKQ